jgi:hypothetical protein
MENNQDPLGNMFQTMFGGGRRRRGGGGMGGGGGQQDWGGWQNQMRNTARAPSTLQPNGALYRGGPPAGAPYMAQANGMVFNNGFNPMTGFIESGSEGRWAPNAQQLSAMNWAMTPWQGSWADPASPNFYLQQQGLPMRQDYFTPGTWRYGAGPADYDNGGYGADGRQYPPAGATGAGPPPLYTNLGPAGGGGRHGGGYGQPPPGGAQGGPPPPYPPGGNGPPGPAAPPPNLGMPSQFPNYGDAGQYNSPLEAALAQQNIFGRPTGNPDGTYTTTPYPAGSGVGGNGNMPATPAAPVIGSPGAAGYGYGAAPGANASNNWTPPGGNFNMYQGMPYAGGMGPNSGWLPPAPGTQQDWGGTGQPSAPPGIDNSGNPRVPGPWG